MKKILFDLMVSQPEAGSKFHGGGEFTKTVFKQLCMSYSKDTEIVAFYNPDLYLDDWIFSLIKKYNIGTLKVKSYNEVVLSQEFNLADVFVACRITGIGKIKYFPAQMKIIGVYHGFRAIEKPIDSTAMFYEDNIVWKIKCIAKLLAKDIYKQKKYKSFENRINKCTYIVGDSKHSGYAAKVFFPNFPEEKIRIFYAPEKNEVSIEGDNKAITDKFILMLGGNRWIKNLYRGARAIDELMRAKQLEEYTVHVIGGIPRDIYKKIKNKDKFISFEYLSPEELEMQYRTCDFFYYPSLNEGFGLPPEEAMKYGKTCLVSGVSSLIEIYENSVYYCNPYDISEMKCRLLQAAKEKIDRNIILERRNRLSMKQQQDLNELCKLIVNC